MVPRAAGRPPVHLELVACGPGFQALETLRRCSRVGGFLCCLALLGACGTSEAPLPPEASPSSPPTAKEKAPSPESEMETWRSRSERATLKTLELAVVGGALADEQMVLDVQLENLSDTSYVLAGDLSGEDFFLREIGGGIHTPLSHSDSLAAPDDGRGIAPGGRIFGTLTFPAPSSEAFELHLRDFEPIQMTRAAFGLGADTPSASTSQVSGRGGGRDARELFSGTERPRIGSDPRSATTDRAGADLRLASITSLLAAQAAALERYDLEAYLDTFAPERRRAEQRIFSRLRQLPVVEAELRVVESTADEGQRRRAQVELSYRLDGLGVDNPFVHQLDYHFEERQGGWLVTAIVDDAQRPLAWRRGDLVAQRSNHFLLYTHPSRRDELVDLATDAESAYASLLSQGMPLDPGYAVYLVADSTEFQWVAGRPRALGVAVARYVTTATGETSVDSRAFYINGSIFANRSRSRELADVLDLTVTHELVHLALAKETRAFTPAWLKEGVAVYFSGDDSYDAERTMVRGGMGHLDLETMTRAASLGEHDVIGRQTTDEYLFAGRTVAYLVEQEGQQKLLDFYRSYAEVSPQDLASLALQDAGVQQAAMARLTEGTPAAPDANLEGALADALTRRLLGQHYGVEITELDAAVRDWLELRHP